VVAESLSTALRVEAIDVRLVRHGTEELVLQFELANETTEPLQPAHLGLDPRTNVIATLVDLPRGTGYAPALWADTTPRIENAFANHARISASSVADIPAGGAATVTVVFPAPPAETSSMLVLTDGFVPVEVPVRPAGDPALVDDPVLLGTSLVDNGSPRVGPVICQSGPGAGSAPSTPTTLRIPSDVLFDFGSATLSPAATSAIETLRAQVSATSGTVLVEGHTDGIDDDASNQRLSEQRAAAVRDALAAELGTGFEYRTTGFGETRPVAPNTRPDGTDDPDGRAQNRRVEVIVAADTDSGQPLSTPTREPVNSALSGSGLVPDVRGIRARSGFTLTQVALRNTSPLDLPLGYINDGARIGVRADYGGELSLTDEGGTRFAPCAFGPAWYDLLANGFPNFTRLGGDVVPAGATVQLWALFAAPPADRHTVQVGIGGLSGTTTAQVIGR
jgi:outer membrane protein OmpA-like peptidoglycan-associated protein